MTGMGGECRPREADAVIVTEPDVTAVDADPRTASTAVGVTYAFDAETWIRRWGANKDRVAAVTAGSGDVRTATARSSPAAHTDAAPIQLPATPPNGCDMATVGVIVHAYLGAWETHDPTVYLDGLERSVAVTDPEAVFRFLHALVARARAVDGRLVASIAAHDLPADTVKTLLPLFDERV
ncbi:MULTISPECIES: hypothetical protein [Halobacterium]|uniref:Uncharacterized protein n=4 Tax=Halobacterium salinarum TaxID=2242 RepID=Q9HMF4_HALSA|nr:MULTISPECIES: hypothetical protein [Halobacterium]AAG20617.1 hypothetical protein VNG_2569H [Halobacterium salinarum NRC-1]MBB6089448.1 hypothetical protein [Halobacterium salinarum]MCF2164566.1 hypothetical protein [Halobacterium salinarum]MCF2166987.1 hypothetical protein [Halobacterium salinarum]MCF2207978.1 hypothetical protein [Halobacterium salinarum]